MLTELLQNLVDALKSKDKKQIEKSYRTLEKVGMDRMTARMLIVDLVKDGTLK